MNAKSYGEQAMVTDKLKEIRQKTIDMEIQALTEEFLNYKANSDELEEWLALKPCNLFGMERQRGE